jgi:hypothetical protein
MTDRQLMQQALDALKIADELCDGHGVDFKEYGLKVDKDIQRKYKKAITALRDRLAHCDRCGKRLGGEGDIHTCTPDPIGDAQSSLIAEMAAQPEQEPVAWMYQCTADNSGPVLLQQKQNWAESGTGLWIETPLYTTPPAQPAVPDFKAFKEWAAGEGYDVAYTHDGIKWVCLNPMTADLWKAWQAAHGIK